MASALGGSSQSSGSSDTTSTQPYIMSGPTVAAANSASAAQISAAQQASQAIQQNTQSAVHALMGQYGTAFQIEQPSIALGNQAANQYNYMLGLGAISAGTAPTAPTAPGSILNNNQFQSLNNQAKSLASTGQFGGLTPDDDLHNVTSIATQLMNSGTPLTAAQQQFIQTYTGTFGGSAGQTGTSFGTDNSITQNQNLEYQNAQQQYGQQMQEYNMQQDQYNKYNQAGTATANNINAIVNNLPGFQASQQQGINAIQNAASASGMLNSGNILEQLNQFGQTMSQQYYQNYMGNLATQANLGASAAQTSANGANTLGANLASAYTNQGAGQANADLSMGQALASSYLTPVANQQVIMTPYTTTSSTNSSGGSSSSGGVLGALGAASSVSQAGGLGKILGGLL